MIASNEGGGYLVGDGQNQDCFETVFEKSA